MPLPLGLDTGLLPGELESAERTRLWKYRVGDSDRALNVLFSFS